MTYPNLRPMITDFSHEKRAAEPPVAERGAAAASMVEDARRPSVEVFFRAIERLEATIELETEALKRNDLAGLADFNRSKSLGLLELTRVIEACRAAGRAEFGVQTISRLSRLREAVEGNLAILQLHLRAVGEVAAIIVRAIDDYESDGTYAPMPAAGGGRR